MQEEILESMIEIVGIVFFYRPSGDVLETFNFLENADDSDEEENDMIEGIPEGKEKLRINKHKVGDLHHFLYTVIWTVIF